MEKNTKKSLLMDFCLKLSETEVQKLTIKPNAEEIVDSYLDAADGPNVPAAEPRTFTKADVVFNSLLVAVLCFLLGILFNPLQAAVEFLFFESTVK